MFTSAELIEALRRRMRRSLRPQPPAGTFPPGWDAWFESMRERVGAVTGATADSLIAVFMAREQRTPARAGGPLNRWRAFNTLWRQQWHPASEDGRGVHVIAAIVTLLAHLLLTALLLYIAYVRLMAVITPATEGELVVQVEYVGDGTPEDVGGGAPDAANEEVVIPVPAPTQVQAASNTQPPPPAQPAQPEAKVEEQAEVPPPPAPPAPQPLQVTEVAQAAPRFTLPPPREVTTPQPQIKVPEIDASTDAIEVVEVPLRAQPVKPVERPVRQAQVAVPELRDQPAEIVVKAPPTPAPPTPIPQIATESLDTQRLKVDVAPVKSRSTAVPRAAAQAPAAESASPPAKAAGTSEASAASTAAAGSPSSSGSHANNPGAGAGATPSPKPGAIPSPKPGDDWGMSDRNRPGAQSGLLNADGSPRLAGGDGKTGGGLAPGTITEDFAKIDRNGTWLKRPPTDYVPTSFDKFWVPNETLLQEWVRRSIKEVLIPIPGTSKKIQCTIAILMLGGGCGITDPNMQDVEAEARKPPEIPFKRDLQEDQGSLEQLPGKP